MRIYISDERERQKKYSKYIKLINAFRPWQGEMFALNSFVRSFGVANADKLFMISNGIFESIVIGPDKSGFSLLAKRFLTSVSSLAVDCAE